MSFLLCFVGMRKVICIVMWLLMSLYHLRIFSLLGVLMVKQYLKHIFSHVCLSYELLCFLVSVFGLCFITKFEVFPVKLVKALAYSFVDYLLIPFFYLLLH